MTNPTKPVLALTLTLIFTLPTVNAQSRETIQLTLNVEKLKQLEAILENMYKGYQVLSKGYNTIRDVAQGNYSLHQAFLDKLYQVSPVVQDYVKVTRIIRYQKLLVAEYKRAYTRLKNDENLTASELRYIGNVYSFLVKRSLGNLEELTMIVTAAKLRMNDEERLSAIDRIDADMEDKLIFLKIFNSRTQLLVVQRAKAQEEINTTRKLHEHPKP